MLGHKPSPLKCYPLKPNLKSGDDVCLSNSNWELVLLKRALKAEGYATHSNCYSTVLLISVVAKYSELLFEHFWRNRI